METENFNLNRNLRIGLPDLANNSSREPLGGASGRQLAVEWLRSKEARRWGAARILLSSLGGLGTSEKTAKHSRAQNLAHLKQTHQ